jgi:nucleoside 2-deoxyribosyltransferase
MIVYLANPYGFSEQQREELLPQFVAKIRSLGHIVWEPFARNNNVDMSNPDWPYYVGQADKSDVKHCDAIFAILNGVPPDSGVCVELGMAIAWGKEIYLFRDQDIIITDNNKYPLNLMIFCGLPNHGWQRHYFTSIDEIDF